MKQSGQIIVNPWRGSGLVESDDIAEGEIETDANAAMALFDLCPVHHTTPLHFFEPLSQAFGIGKLWLKMEDQRMGLGSFKALGAVYAIAKMAARRGNASDVEAMSKALAGETFICASAGNHGLSVAAGARLFGANAVVLLSQTVPEEFAERLQAKGAQVIRAGADYEESLQASLDMAAERGWTLLADGTWQGYTALPRDVMEGYLIMGHEVARDIPQPPTHVFLQAGVGGLAAACAASARVNWGEEVKIVVVEPTAAPALIESIKAGKPVDTQGPVSTMGRLDCKAPSHLALKYLAQEADYFVTLDDDMVDEALALLGAEKVKTTPSGAAGVSAVHHFARDGACGLDETSHVVCYISEGPA